VDFDVRGALTACPVDILGLNGAATLLDSPGNLQQRLQLGEMAAVSGSRTTEATRASSPR
jgi:hypothetical protein